MSQFVINIHVCRNEQGNELICKGTTDALTGKQLRDTDTFERIIVPKLKGIVDRANQIIIGMTPNDCMPSGPATHRKKLMASDLRRLADAIEQGNPAVLDSIMFKDPTNPQGVVTVIRLQNNNNVQQP